MNAIRLALSVLIATFFFFSIGTDIDYPFINNLLSAYLITLTISLLVLWFLPIRSQRKYAFLATGFSLLTISLVARWQASTLSESLTDKGIEQSLTSEVFNRLVLSAEHQLIDSYYIAIIALLVLLLGGVIAWLENRKKP